MKKAGTSRSASRCVRRTIMAIGSFTVVVATMPAAGWGVTILGAPSAYVEQPQNVAARMEVMSKGTGTATFRRVEGLHGEGAAQETIRLSDEAWSNLEIGETYVVGYTRLRRPPRTHGVYEPDPAGPRLLEAPAVGPVLLADIGASRLLVLRPKEGASPATRLAAVLDTLEAGDLLSARFAAAELVFRDDLQAAIDTERLPRLRKVIEGARTDAQLQELLLRAAMSRADLAGGTWLVAASKRVLDRYGIDLDFASFVPALLQSAARALAAAGSPSDTAAIAPHLRSRHPGVAKVALEAIDRLDTGRARSAATAALAAPDLPAENRRVLERYLRGAPAGP